MFPFDDVIMRRDDLICSSLYVIQHFPNVMKRMTYVFLLYISAADWPRKYELSSSQKICENVNYVHYD